MRPVPMVAPVLDELADEMDGKVQVAKLNVDENQELAMQFRVSSIPTFILFKDGQIADRMMGAMPKSAFQSFIDRNLTRAERRRLGAPRSVDASRRSRALVALGGSAAARTPTSLLSSAAPSSASRSSSRPRGGAAAARLPHPDGARRGGGDRPRAPHAGSSSTSSGWRAKRRSRRLSSPRWSAQALVRCGVAPGRLALAGAWPAGVPGGRLRAACGAMAGASSRATS